MSTCLFGNLARRVVRAHANVATGGAEWVTVKSILAIFHGETCGE